MSLEVPVTIFPFIKSRYTFYTLWFFTKKHRIIQNSAKFKPDGLNEKYISNLLHIMVFQFNSMTFLKDSLQLQTPCFSLGNEKWSMYIYACKFHPSMKNFVLVRWGSDLWRHCSMSLLWARFEDPTQVTYNTSW